MPADDEPSRKKRGAENQLTQHNWEEDEDENGPASTEGEFRKAPEEELAKRKIIKARRSCKNSAGGADGADTVAEKPATSAAATPFSWSTPAPTSDGKSEPTKKVDEAPAEASSKDKEKELAGAASKDNAASTAAKGSTDAAEKKPLFSFPSTGTSGFGSFGSMGTFTGFSGFGSAGSFGASGTSSSFGSTSFGSFGSTPSFSFSFSNAPTQVDAFKAAKKDGEEGGEDGGEDGGGGEDVEKEVVVEKTCQLEEVETCTGEEDEQTVFQVRGKLFIFCAPPGSVAAGGKETPVADSAKGKDEDTPAVSGGEGSSKEAKPSWVVIGIGNLRVNVPKEGCTDKSGRPRIVMRRQKTFQVCLNTYLFESMVCDKAGPKDVRFTGMRMDVETGATEAELATYLLRVKEEEQADEFISLIHKYKNAAK